MFSLLRLLSHWLPLPLIMAAPAPASLPEEHIIPGLFHEMVYGFMIPAWIRAIYTEDVGRRGRLDRLDRMQLVQIEHWKQKSGWQHEYIYVHVRYDGPDGVHMRYIRIERIGQVDAEGQEGLRSLPSMTGAFSPDWMRTSAEGSSYSTAALFGTRIAGDAVLVDPYRYDTVHGRRKWPSDVECLYRLEFPAEHRPNVLHLALAVDQVQTIGPKYAILGTMCYWHARCVYEILKTKFGGQETAMPAAAKRGAYNGNRCINDHLEFDMSQLSHDVLRNAVRKFRRSEQAASGSSSKPKLPRMPWRGSSSLPGRDSARASPDDEVAITDAMTRSLEAEALVVCERHPEIVRRTAESSATSSALPAGRSEASPARFVEPVEKTLEEFDSLYAAKQEDIEARVLHHMDPVERELREDNRAKDQELRNLRARLAAYERERTPTY
ncbi:hypothetical protein BD626DRAFT_477337 [Schizophyllum amplum]|uniref:START domain-containing protein n=1 Tax=Schizophyllum amplum TaxID=97359 RepID=A0A550D037_9AGAR|nr:hypothetical protein BD626DRAFT_477337 [Auriculariopsis ampla]